MTSLSLFHKEKFLSSVSKFMLASYCSLGYWCWTEAWAWSALEAKIKRKAKEAKKPTPVPLEIHWNWKRLWSFVFCRVERSAAGSAREQRKLGWALMWYLICKGRKGIACMTVPVCFVEILTIDFTLPYFVQTGCIAQDSIRHFGWQGQVYCKGHLRYLLHQERIPTQALLGFPAASWLHNRMCTGRHNKKAWSGQDTWARVFFPAPRLLPARWCWWTHCTTLEVVSVASHVARQRGSFCASSTASISLYPPWAQILQPGLKHLRLIQHLLQVTAHREIMPLFRLKWLCFTPDSAMEWVLASNWLFVSSPTLKNQRENKSK